MISHFFIDRPIFASVCSIVITLAGVIAMLGLPMAQYPPIAPPTVQVSCSYPGASALVLADTVAAPIEQQVNGVEGMIYMSSQCGNDGSYNLTVTFDLDANLNTALVMVQNRISLALPQLPDSVQKQGLTIKKKSPNIMMVVNFFSPIGRYNDVYLSNYATINVKDELLRVDGVGDITYLGQRDYSIRAWLDPQQMASRNITANEVASAIQKQNSASALGQIGQQPQSTGQDFQLPMDTLGRLVDPDQFGDIIVKAVPGEKNSVSAPIVRLRDVARLELGAANYNQICSVDGMPSAALAVYQLPGTNALDVAKRVRDKMEELKKRFPEGLEYDIYYDTTPFIRESVNDVVVTLLEAVALVAIVVLAFLQNWRAAVIPLIAVPVAIIGTFAVMAAIGFSLNNISLFGLVLAIGIVVDDAIVVVENVERWIAQGLSSREAARRAMQEVTGPVIAVGVVLCAVFLPCAFISGITGQFFKQFAVTIAVSTVFSALNSLTLSPALAALLLKPHGAKQDGMTRMLDSGLGWFFRFFNRAFEFASHAYARLVGVALRVWYLAILVYLGLLGLTGWLFSFYPVGFIPQQDQGWLLVNVQLPDSASVQRTQDVMLQLNKIAKKTPGVAHTTSVAGQSILLNTNSSNFGSMFVVLDAFDKRKGDALSAGNIMLKLREQFRGEVRDAKVDVFGAPPVPGIGIASGFKIMVEDRGSLGLSSLQKQTDALVDAISRQPGFLMVSTQFRSSTPQLKMDIDRAKVRSLGVSINDVDQALQIFLGSFYVNNFNAFGRSWQVNIQAEGSFRNRISDIGQFKVRNLNGDMIPLSTLVRMSDNGGPVMVNRYNLYASGAINGVIIPPLSTGEGIEVVERLVDEKLPKAMATEWTDLTYMQIKAGNTAMYVFALAVVFVFLALAAQYESWSLPLAVILVVPMCLLCSLLGVFLRHIAMDIFVQIGFVVLVGLACKNAILIVEFAKQLREENKSCFEATTEACRLRLRPILMTSFAFILGVLPMVIAHGAGAEMRWSLGTAVFSGMLGVTLFGIFLTPVFFYVIESLGQTRLLRLPSLQWLGALLFGPLLGAAAGYLLGKSGATHLPLRWTVLGGFALGMLTALIVQRARRSKNTTISNSKS